MHGVTILWSMAVAASLLVAGIHLLVWWRNRASWSSVALVLASFGAAGAGVAEYCVMRAETTTAFVAALRWSNFPILAVFCGIVWFVQREFGTGRRWFAAGAVGLRGLVLVLSFFPGPSIMYREVLSLRELVFLGEKISVVGEAVPTPWAWLAVASNLALVVFVGDASLRLWRRGGTEDRSRAVRVGGAICLFIVGASVVAMLVNAHVLHIPYLTSVSYLVIVLLLGHELSRDLLRAEELVRTLRSREAQLVESERRLHLAGEAADLGLWFLDMRAATLWATDRAKRMFGFPVAADVTFEMFLQRVHPEDRALVEERIAGAVQGDGRYVAEYRIVLPDGTLRWISAHGEVSHGPGRSPSSLTGVVFDITERRRAELELAEQRAQLTHLARVSTVAELSGSLAHEINQPLAIILTNAQAAQRLLAQDPPDLAEAREILADIVREDQRAGEVIRRLRGLLRNEQINLQPVAVGELVDEVLHLLRRDLDGKGVRVERVAAAEFPQIRGDPVQLQQVLLNLILNACEAMEACPAGERLLVVSTACLDGHVRISVADTGCGSPLDLQRVFEPFYTTKPLGLGLGLAICRSIIAAHRGRLWAEVRPPAKSGQAHGGGVFHIELEALPRE